jgi:hypothetical protein
MALLSKRLDIFEGKLARFNLILPLLFLPGFLFPQFWFKWPDIQSSLHIQLMFLSEIIFLNYIHVAFTAAMIFGLPQGRQWLKSLENPIRVLILMVVLCVVLSLLYALGKGVVFYGDKVFHHSLMVMIFVNTIWFIHHGVAQIKGLSLQYNYKFRSHFSLNSSDLELLKNSEISERKMGVLITIFSSISLLLSYDYVGGSMEHGLRQGLILGATGVALICFARVTYVVSKVPMMNRTFKILFLSRLLFTCLMGVNYVAFLGRLCTHGIEYTLVFQKVARNSKLNEALKFLMLTFTLVLVAFFIHTFGNERGGYFNINPLIYQNPLWIQVMVVVYLLTTPIHYYLDHLIFRMKKSSARNFTGELLR